MDAVRATWSNGRILPAQAVAWPEGSELIVEPVGPAGERFGIDESEWSDGDEALADWERWLPTIEPPLFSEVECSRFAEYEQKFRAFKREAVSRQMICESNE